MHSIHNVTITPDIVDDTCYMGQQSVLVSSSITYTVKQLLCIVFYICTTCTVLVLFNKAIEYIKQFCSRVFRDAYVIGILCLSVFTSLIAINATQGPSLVWWFNAMNVTYICKSMNK